MYLALCPDGAEGASYAMLSAFSDMAKTGASNIGIIMAGIWNVSNSTLESNNISGLWKLTVLTSILPLFPIALIWLLPEDVLDQSRLAKVAKRSVIGGFIFLSILLISLVWTVSTALYRLYNTSNSDDSN